MSIPKWIYNHCPNGCAIDSLHTEMKEGQPVHGCPECGFRSDPGTWPVGLDTEVVEFPSLPTLDQMIQLVEEFPFGPPKPGRKTRLLFMFNGAHGLHSLTQSRQSISLDYVNYREFLLGLKMAKLLM